MITTMTKSLRGKLMVVVLTTAVFALLVTAVALVIYEIRTYETSLVADLETQAEILGRATETALTFNDRKVAEENLGLLRLRPQIQAAAIYSADGQLFASHVQGDATVPTRAGTPGHSVQGDRMTLFLPIQAGGETLGSIYLSTRYELSQRLADYLGILGAVMLTSLLIATLLSAWLQGRITRPILEVTDVARQVMERRDFSLRAQASNDDEVGYLVDAFNDMLAEVGRRAKALESAYETLQHEIEERRSAEMALRVADRRKDEFLATLAHELRNPLAPLRNGLHILKLPNADAAMKSEVQDLMERQVSQLVRLVDDLLDVSRITTGKLALKRSRIELSEVVKSAIDTAKPLIEARRHRFSVELPPDRITLDGDPTRLAQVLSNLLNNAAKYTPPGGSIRLSVRTTADRAIVAIEDNGIGIPRQMLDRVFEMFTQVETSLDRETAGLGVGLSLARRLVEMHGGTIAAESDGPNLGSRFVVTLPATIEPGVARSAAPAVPAIDAGPRRLRVLLADDNVDFASSFAVLLRSMGHEVLVRHDGASALAAAPAFAPDVAFLDIGLPKLHGYALARKLRENAATRTATLVAVTGWGQEQDRAHAKEAGFDRHLVKPVEPAQILEILNAVA